MVPYLGDAPLRPEVEQMLRGLGDRNRAVRERAIALLRSGLEGPGVQVFPGRHSETRVALAALLGRLAA